MLPASRRTAASARARSMAARNPPLLSSAILRAAVSYPSTLPSRNLWPKHSSSTAGASAEPSSSPSSATSDFPRNSPPTFSDSPSPFIRPVPFSIPDRTVLPTPLPHDVLEKVSSPFKAWVQKGDNDIAELHSASLHEGMFPSTYNLENLAILNACLSIGLIGRAKVIFTQMRREAKQRVLAAAYAAKKGEAKALQEPMSMSSLDARVYDSFIKAVLLHAAKQSDSETKTSLVEEAWSLFKQMDAADAVSGDPTFEAAFGAEEDGHRTDWPVVPYDPLPSAVTYAVLLQGIVRADPVSPRPDELLSSLLSSIRRRNIPLSTVFSALPSPYSDVKTAATADEDATDDASATADSGETRAAQGPDAAQVMDRLAVVALNRGDMVAVRELGELAEKWRSERQKVVEEDQKDGQKVVVDVPTLVPVKTAVKDKTTGETTHEVSFNLRTLQNSLATVQSSSELLSDNYARQKMLEDSAYEAAKKRFFHESEKLVELGLHHTGPMKQRTLQSWMWEWYNKMQEALKERIAKIEEAERGKRRGREHKKSATEIGQGAKDKETNADGPAEDGVAARMAEEMAAKDTTEEAVEGGEPVKERKGKKVKEEPSLEDGSGNQGTRRPKENDQLAPFLRLLPIKKLALIPILELMRLQGSGGVSDGMKLAHAAMSIGSAVELEYHAELIKRNPDKFSNSKAAQQALGTRNLLDLRARKEIKNWLDEVEVNSVDSWMPRWTHPVKAKVGSFLIDLLKDVATVEKSVEIEIDGVKEIYTEVQPAFMHQYQYVRGRRIGVLMLNSVVSDRLQQDPLVDTLHPRHLPMLVPPKPWLDYKSGGYYTNEIYAMRFKDFASEQLSYLRKASDAHQIDIVLSGLDVLGDTAWQINNKVFDVVAEVWNSGKPFAKIPPAYTDTTEPDRPPDYDTNVKAKGLHFAMVKQKMLLARTNHSQRCDVNYKLEIAKSFLHEKFYMPHNMDFRGRAYPIPPHLSHIGDDLCRGLLKFADAKPLGTRGLRWLKIHVANVYGFDKASFDERENWTMDNLENIFDAADRPLEGSRWWLKADDPWQTLATCFELAEALRSPDPEKFESCLPVHQDGTCNGLQHYAALGGDLAGAKQVNLAEGDRPSDVYTAVAELVIRELDEDAAKGNQWAKLLQGKVTRKVVKQPVMTTVYGVTYVGAKNQIRKQLSDRGDLDPDQTWQCSAYLATKVIQCIGDLFKGARQIQEWLSKSAKLIAKSIPPDRIEAAKADFVGPKKTTNSDKRYGRMPKEQMTSVIWTTPLGLPIVQPYRKAKMKQVATTLQTVFIQDPNASTEVNPAKQASAFPPNFIHSLDATHMILTALSCKAAGLTFASVHDSYWTHACSIDTMAEYIRDTFIHLHSADILKHLRDEFLARYEGYKVPVVALRRAVPQQALVMTQEQMDSLEGEEGTLVVEEDGTTSTTTDGSDEADLGEEEAGLGALENQAEADAEKFLPTFRKQAERVRAERVTKIETQLGKKRRLRRIPDDLVSRSKYEETLAEAEEQEAMDLAGEEGAEIEDGAEAEEGEEAMEGGKKGKAKGKRKAAGSKKKGKTEIFRTKFVSLADVLPPLPEKGGFDVKNIKKSMYFFS